MKTAQPDLPASLQGLPRIPTDPRPKAWSSNEAVWIRDDSQWPTVVDPVTKVETQIIPQHQGLLTGIPSNNLCVIDVDNQTGKQGGDPNTDLHFQQVCAWLDTTFGLSPETTLTCKTKSGGLHYYVQFPPELVLKNRVNLPIDQSKPTTGKASGTGSSKVAGVTQPVSDQTTQTKSGVDFRGTGGYVNIPPTPGFEWVDPSIPPITAPLTLTNWVQVQSSSYSSSSSSSTSTPDLYKLLLQPNLTEGERNDTLFRLAASWAWQLAEDPDAEAMLTTMLFAAADRTTPPYRGSKEDAELLSMVTRTLERARDKLATRRATLHLATPTNRSNLSSNYFDPSCYQAQSGMLLPPDSDGLARRLLLLNPPLAYSEGTGWWRKDRVWKPLNTLDLQLKIIDTLNELLDQERTAGQDHKLLARMRSRYGNNVEQVEKALRPLFFTPELSNLDLREYAHLIGFTNGVLDLSSPTTPQLIPEAPDGTYPLTWFDYEIPTDWSTQIPTPVWDSIVYNLASGDPHYIHYIHQLLGYTLLGTNQDQAFLLMIGAAAAGKSAFVNAVLKVFPSPAGTSMSPDIFSSRTSEATRGSALRASMGARFLALSEVSAVHVLDINEIKRVTGGDELEGREAYSRTSFKFIPTFTPFIIGNDDPPFYEAASLAVKRRFIKLPITSSLPPSDRMPMNQLLNHIQQERPGILLKILDGLASYVSSGKTIQELAPSVVSTSTTQMLDNADIFLPFIENELVFEPQASTPSASLKLAMQSYMRQVQGLSTKETPGVKAIKQRVLSMGVSNRHTETGQVYQGVRLKNPSESPTHMALNWDPVASRMIVTFDEQVWHDDNNQPTRFYKNPKPSAQLQVVSTS